MESALGKFLNYLREQGLFSKVCESAADGKFVWGWQNYKLVIDGLSEGLLLYNDVGCDNVDYELVYSFDRQVGHAFPNYFDSNVKENDVIAVLAMHLVNVQSLNGSAAKDPLVVVQHLKFNTGSVPEALMTESSAEEKPQ
jgi:hypothetical protein